MPDIDAKPPSKSWIIPVDGRDVLGAIGAVLVAGGAFLVSPALTMLAIGGGCIYLAWLAAKPKP